MSDFLVELGQNPVARHVIESLSLPVPMPQKLRRVRAPWDERPLHDRHVVFAAAPGSCWTPAVADTLASSGANPVVVTTDDDIAGLFVGPGEAYGRPAQILSGGAIPDDLRPHGLLFDASGIETADDLRALYDFHHAWLGALAPNGRVVVLGRAPETETRAMGRAVSRGLEGFVRSVAKELGRKGSTAHVVYAPRDGSGASPVHLPPLLRFVLSDRSAFITGQPWHVRGTDSHPQAISWTRSLEKRVALVTGAARGIGKATARALAAEGAHVVCLDRPADDGPCAQIAREIGGTPLLVDLADGQAAKTIVDHLKSSHGGVDIVVHNAGITRDKTLRKMSGEQWDDTITVNLRAVMELTHALLEDGLRDNGRVICLSSVTGLAGNLGQSNYATSKAAVLGFVEALAGPLTERGITINAVAPGFIETRLTRDIPAATREIARRLSALSQGGEPSDVAELVTFLAMPGGFGLTGQIVRVCGGMFVGA